MCAKNREKILPLGHFSRRALEKNCDFERFGRKIKINQDLVGMLRNLTDTDLQSSVKFRTNLDLF